MAVNERILAEKESTKDEMRRKNWDNEHKRIFLSLTIFKSWKDAKNIAGYELCSDSDFAAHLLSLEYRRR